MRFNSRIPCGVRPLIFPSCCLSRLFQFTHPVWGATTQHHRVLLGIRRFNSRTPCGVRLKDYLHLLALDAFQFTHPVWGATVRQDASGGARQFQFTHPVWGATSERYSSLCISWSFNSRTPCGVRPIKVKRDGLVIGFNSRTPCGVRLLTSRPWVTKRLFQFTHPVWGATPPHDS